MTTGELSNFRAARAMRIRVVLRAQLLLSTCVFAVCSVRKNLLSPSSTSSRSLVICCLFAAVVRPIAFTHRGASTPRAAIALIYLVLAPSSISLDLVPTHCMLLGATPCLKHNSVPARSPLPQPPLAGLLP